MAKFKGTVYLSTREFLLHRFDTQGLDLALNALPPDTREKLDAITPLGWYDVRPVLQLHHAMEEVFDEPPGVVCYEAGRFSAAWSMNSILKVFVRFTTPHWLMEKAGSVWSRYHDSGRWEFKPPQPQRMTGSLHDYAVEDPLFFHRLRGWLAGAVELTGGKGAQVRHQARAGVHHFSGTWD